MILPCYFLFLVIMTSFPTHTLLKFNYIARMYYAPVKDCFGGIDPSRLSAWWCNICDPGCCIWLGANPSAAGFNNQLVSRGYFVAAVHYAGNPIREIDWKSSKDGWMLGKDKKVHGHLLLPYSSSFNKSTLRKFSLRFHTAGIFFLLLVSPVILSPHWGIMQKYVGTPIGLFFR